MTKLPFLRPAPEKPVGAGVSLCGAGGVHGDAILTDPAGRLWAVADGAGRAEASDCVIRALQGLRLSDGNPAPALIAAFETAHRRLARRDLAGVSAVVAAVEVAVEVAADGAADGAALTLAWVGGCRAYLLRHGRLVPLTRDHSILQCQAERGALRPTLARRPGRQSLTQTLGQRGGVAVETARLALQPGDRLLLCSDGLTSVLEDDQMAEAMVARMAAGEPPRRAAERLGALALQAAAGAGAADAVSAVVVEVPGEPAQKSAHKPGPGGWRAPRQSFGAP